MKVNSYNEWDKLKEVVVGRPESRAFLTFNQSGPIDENKFEYLSNLASEAFPKYFIDEVEESMNKLCKIIEDFGAKIHRPRSDLSAGFFSTPNWSSTGINTYNARDLHLVVGDTIIESPSHMKHRYYEPQAYHEIFLDYMRNGSKWISAPKPKLDGDYRIPFFEDGKKYHKLAESEILFEAANTLRMGRDLIYLVSGSGNYLGATWLQSVLGSNYKVHTTEGIYRSAHIDSTLIVLRPGLVLINGQRVNEENCPPLFDKWDKIWFTDIQPYPEKISEFHEKIWKPIQKQFEDNGVQSDLDYMTTEWTGMNLLSLDESTVIVDIRQKPLIDILEKYNFTVIPHEVEHQYLMKGAFHCCTLDTVREGGLESYF